MNALCLVAHPDDCVIFAYSYMWHHSEWDWTVAYLTTAASEPRAREIAEFWQRRKITTKFIGLVDHWQDNDTKTFNFWNPDHAQQQCWDLACAYDLVLTHGQQGEYGHIHHCLVHKAVAQHPNLVTFADINTGQEYVLPPEAYDLAELPLHAHMIMQFHPTQHRNFYQGTTQ